MAWNNLYESEEYSEVSWLLLSVVEDLEKENYELRPFDPSLMSWKTPGSSKTTLKEILISCSLMTEILNIIKHLNLHMAKLQDN